MTYKKTLPIIAFISCFFMSCEDQIMEWQKDPDKKEVTTAELPLELTEKIGRYEPLKTYTNFILGSGIGVNLYLGDETFSNIVDENFHEVTAGYDMKHGPMVGSDGSLNFEKIDNFIAKTKAAGLSVFGHTLIWHQNQDASYLNSLIAPTIIPGSSGTNLLDLSSLEDGSLNGWGAWNSGDGITVIDEAGLSSDSKAVQLISNSTSSQPYNLQLITPDITVVSGHTYEVSFYIKSDITGQGRISFEGLSNNYPYKDWYATGGSWTESFETTSTWQQVKFTVDDFTGATFKIAFDLGYLPNVTYLIDVNTINVTDLDAESSVVNLVTNGTFETGIDGWAKWNGDELSHADAANAYEGSGAMKVVNNADGNAWSTQIHTDFTESLALDEVYTVSFLIRSEVAGSIRCSTTGNAKYQGDQATSTTWTPIEWEITGTGGETGLNFDLGSVAGTYYIDNVVVTSGEPAGGSGPTIIEKTDEEKATIIEAAMEDWISQMVGHYKNDVFAWDVVNEPIKNGSSGELRDGNVTDLADDEFYWVKYLGEDYGVKAFKLARQYGNPTDKLFINDYNLESNLDKCDGLIQYTAYIDSQGVTVDGIGTQMHISLNNDKDKIKEMFTRLAATGKLIKISELDVRLGTKSPTADQLAEQAEMYRFVIDSYKSIIPESQQYGITIWGISDNEQEHEYWLPDESPNLWDANYLRKHAYKGVADGLAGRDVSEDFSGELIID